jgi:ABC-2 type transport system ATP-binding protein
VLGVKEKRVEEVINLLGIGEVVDRRPGSYSTGMKQRLGMAMAIIHQPKLLILDEPTNGMDPAGIKSIRVLVKNLASQGATILLCSHLLHEVEQVCNRVAIFNKGKVVSEGSLAELQQASNTVCINTLQHDKTVHFLAQFPDIKVLPLKDGKIEIIGIDPQSLMEALVRNGLTPVEVYLRDDSLEELFIELTAKEE